MHEFRCEVRGEDLLATLMVAPLPLGLKDSPLVRGYHRDIYLDTPDAALRRRDARCRLRIGADDRRLFTLSYRTGAELARYAAEVQEVDPRDAIAGSSEPARRLRGLVDPKLLRPRLEIETERVLRRALAGFLSRPRFELVYDQSTVRVGGLARSFQELKVRRVATGAPTLEQLEKAMAAAHGLRLTLTPKLDRAEALLSAMESEARARAVSSSRAVAVLAVDNGRLAFLSEGGSLRLPIATGSGEDACRHLLKETLGSSVGELRLLGTASALGLRPALEVWAALRLRRGTEGAERPRAHEWLPLEEALARVGSPALRDPDTLAALTVAARTDVLSDSRVDTDSPRAGRALTLLPAPVLPAAALDTQRSDPEQFINAELSLVEFDARVLALAEDRTVPLLSRLFYLSVFGSNLDELFMVRVGALKDAISRGGSEQGVDGLTPAQELSAIALRVRPLLARAQSAWSDIRKGLAAEGVRVLTWAELGAEARTALTRTFTDDIYPLLTPRAITVSPGHPFPLLPHLTLSFAVVLEDLATGPPHFAQLKMPSTLPRFLEVPGRGPGGRDVVPLEELIRAHLASVYPGRRAAQGWLFRVTRFADIDVEEVTAGDLLQAIEEEVRTRTQGFAVRVEVERGMPAPIRELLLKELRLERGFEGAGPSDPELYEVPGFLDLTAVKELASLPRPELRYPPFEGRPVLPEDRSVFETLRERDVLLHHPYDDFAASVGRFLSEAAADPQVVAMKITLYRAGDSSPVVDALHRAALSGKEVAAFVELKARFDEERNIGWVKTLEKAGASVVYGLVGLKNHAKVTLVVRREDGKLKRYVHIGTGNYNASTARFYTDMGLLSADEELGADLTDLFNDLTGASRAPRASFRRLLVAPKGLLPELEKRVEREIENAAAGRPARIRAKLNGLSDARTIRLLYRASQAGVDVELIVRSICMLRPGVQGLSERVRVMSILGRFLEHARVVIFENGGDPEVFLASADWRPRNLRRRVEVAVPVLAPDLKARVLSIWDVEWKDPRAWDLTSHGAWVRRETLVGETPPTAQDLFVARSRE